MGEAKIKVFKDHPITHEAQISSPRGHVTRQAASQVGLNLPTQTQPYKWTKV